MVRPGDVSVSRDETRQSEKDRICMVWLSLPQTPLLTLSDVPKKVANTVERVVSKGESDSELDTSLSRSREGSERRDEVRRVDRGVDGVEAVSEGTGVEEASERNTSETVTTRHEPSQLRLVNVKVRRVGAVHALLVEGLELLHLGDALGLDEAAEHGLRRRAERGRCGC
jgi:hypothetical protein